MGFEVVEMEEKRNSTEHVNERDPAAVRLNPKKTSLSGKTNKSVKTNGQNDQTADISYFNSKKQKSDRGVT